MTTTESGPEASVRFGGALLEIRGVSKFLPGVRVLEGIGFTPRTEGMHAPASEGGAGKSTLMKVFSRFYQPNEGGILMWGESITLPTPFAAQQAGVSVIHQEFFLMSHPTAAQSMFIGREPRLSDGLLDHKKLNNNAAEPLGRLGAKIDPCIQVGKLTVASRQLLETAKVLSFNPKVLIIDGPTAALDDTEVETLFRVMDGFIGPDTGIVYISHCMEEIRRKSTRIIVLHDGKSVDSRPSSEVTIPKITQLIVGCKLASDMRPKPRESIEAVFSAKELSAAELLKSVNFHLEKGEILGSAGLMGAGHTGVAWALIGVDPRTGDIVTVGGKQMGIHNPEDAVKTGIGYPSEGRKRYGLVLQ